MGDIASSANAGLSKFIKTRFPQRELESLVSFETPLLNSLARVDDLDGDGTIIPMKLDDAQTLGYSLASIHTSGADPYINPSKGVRFTLVPHQLYASHIIDGKTMLKMRKDEGAWFRLRENEIKAVLAQIGRDFERKLWSGVEGGKGSLALFTADPGTGTTGTVSTSQIINLHEGMIFQVMADSSGSPDASTIRAGGPYTIDSVDYDAGTFTTTGAFNAAVANGDHIVRVADDPYADTTADQFVGVQGWIPSGTPASIYSVTRTSYSRQKIAGWTQSYLGSIEESAKTLLAKMHRFNRRPKSLWLSYSNFNRLEMELGARAYRMEDGQSKMMGATGIGFSTPHGPVAIKVGPYVPDSAGFVLDEPSWKLHTLGAVPHIIDDDGNVALRVQSVGNQSMLDAIEIRFRALCALFCHTPMNNGRFTIS